MSQEKRTGGSGPPAQMRIRLKYADVPTFIERFSDHVSRSGIFIISRTPKPVGTAVRFELLLADGKTKLLKGEGIVSWVREFDVQSPQQPHGMGVRFARLDSESRQLVDRIVSFKRERGVRDDGAVPQPVAEKDDISTPVALPITPDLETLFPEEKDLDATLAHARAIARRLLEEEDVDSLLATDAALPPPPEVVLPPLPMDDTPAVPTEIPPPPPAPPALAAELPIDPDVEPTHVQTLEEDQTRERAPTPLSPDIDIDVGAVLDSLDLPEEAAPEQAINAEATQPQKQEKKGFFSKLFKK